MSETPQQDTASREAEAIRELRAVLLTDFSVAAKILASMIGRGFTAEETQEAVSRITKRTGNGA